MASMLETLKIIVGRRWALIAVIFAIEIAVILAVSLAPFPPSELAIYERQYNSTAAVLNESAAGQVAGIFANNFRVASVELIPILGLGILGLSLFETARIIEVISIMRPEPIGIALGTLFFLPSTWLELPAYAIAAAESIYLVRAIIRSFTGGGRWRFGREIRFLVVNILLIAGVLIVAAIFEVTEIQIAEGPVQTQPYALLTWLPFFAVLAGVIVYWKKAKREAPAIEERDAAESAQSSLPFPGEQPPAQPPPPPPAQPP